MAASPVVFGRAKWLNANTLLHGGWDLRPSNYGAPRGPGVAGYDDYRVIQRQAGANMSVDVGTTAATAVGLAGWVRGSTRGHQGLYECTTVDWSAPTTDTYVAQLNIDVSANASGNPRLDMVVLEVLDAQHTGSSSVTQIRMVNGTGTGGATLDNRSGAAALPASCILLADILVPNGAASIVTADIRDRRAFPLHGVVPPLLTDVDSVSFESVSPIRFDGVSINNDLHDGHQAAVLCYLPRRIVAATRLRWKYSHGATANTGNYLIGIYDASGRQIITTGSVAWTGAANTIQVRSETITATTLDAGLYYVLFALDTATAGASSVTEGYLTSITAASFIGVSAPNVAFRVSSGGVTAPTTILAFTDVSTLTATTNVLPVPVVTVSVG